MLRRLLILLLGADGAEFPQWQVIAAVCLAMQIHNLASLFFKISWPKQFEGGDPNLPITIYTVFLVFIKSLLGKIQCFSAGFSSAGFTLDFFGWIFIHWIYCFLGWIIIHCNFLKSSG
jgi:hypothetical protein